MMLICEKCQTKYMVKPESIPSAGRSVKCVKCGHTWKQFPEGVTPPGVINPTPETLRAIPKGGALPVVHDTSGLMGLKVASILLFFIAISVSFVLYQKPILRRVPALAPVYAMIGLPDTRGLMLQDLAIGKKNFPDEATQYVLKGKLVNRSTGALQVPSVKISIVDKDRAMLRSFVLKSSGEQIAAGKTINFSNALLNMPKNATYITVDIGNKAELLLR